MKKLNLYILFALLSTVVFAQTIEKVDSEMVFKAMEDEMRRNMEELKVEDNKTPFYIEYNVTKAEKTKIVASLGALVESISNPNSTYGVSVKMGNYDLTDEKFTDKVNKRQDHNDGYFSLPKDLCYDGVRRSLWLATNNSYKRAVEAYKNKTELMKKQGLKVEDLPSPDFSKEEVSVTIIPALSNEVSNTQLEDIAREISSEFKGYKNVIESEVEIDYQNVVQYGVNSEGMKFQVPNRFYLVIVNAAVLDSKNQPINQKLEYYQNSINKLPSVEEIKADVKSLVENLNNQKNAPRFTEVYNGPVLFLEDACTQLCFSRMFDKGMGLVGNPRPLVNKPNEGLIRGTARTWEDYKDKKVIDKKLSVELKSELKEYKGVSLIGTQEVDLDGLKAHKSDTLIIDGILKKQIIGRIPTASQHKSICQNRFYIQNDNFSKKIGPSVAFVSSSEVETSEQIRKDMLEIAEEEDLDFVFVIKPLKTKANNAPLNYYKLNLKDGSEELVRGVSYKFSEKTLSKIHSVGDGELVQNILIPDHAEIDNKMARYKGAPEEILEIIRKQMVGVQGMPTSIICPDALLIESVELNGSKGSLKAVERVVDNPLTLN